MPKFWVVLATAAIGTVAITADVQAQDEAAFRAQMIARCNTIRDRSARYACYDAANAGPIAPPPAAASPSVATSPAGPVASVAPATPVASAAPAAPVATNSDRFGINPLRVFKHPERDSDKVEARVVEANDDQLGYWMITLDSGARWKLLEREPYFRPPHGNEVVRIKHTAMGGYLMAVDGQAFVRVVRVD